MTSNDHTSEVFTAMVPMASISVQVGFNPRRAFRQVEMDQLVNAIRDEGLSQPILLRPRRDDVEGYWIVAGERRYRACSLLGVVEIPALIRDLDDDQARLAALRENTVRANLSAAEEALAARAALDFMGGDRTATAKQLDWSVGKLEARLLLLTASDAVLQAVADGTIHVGHAELLAGLPAKQQDGALARIIEHGVSIADLREQVKGIVIPLTSAIFDTTACQSCPFNTQLQGSLFGDSVQGAHCKNKVCFSEKTQAELETKRARLSEEVSTVALSTEKDPSSYIPLMVNGEGGVGEVQYNQCRSCVHFGALIHAKMDARIGQVDRPLCFDRICNAVKVKEHADELADAAHSDEDAAKDAPEAKSAAPVKGKANAKPATKTKAPAKASSKANPKSGKTSAPAASSSKSRAAMIPAYRSAAASLLANDPKIALAVGLQSVLMALRTAGITVDKNLATRRDKVEDELADLIALDAESLSTRFRSACSAMLTGDLPNAHFSRNDVFPAVMAARLAQVAGVDLAAHFSMSDAYLAGHTREGIQGVLAEAGFDVWLKEQTDGAVRWKTLVASKKDDLPAAIMACGFDWSGFVPAAVRSVVPRSFVGL